MADRAQSSNMSGVADKGKSKAVDTHEDVSMGEDESEEDDSGDEYDVSIKCFNSSKFSLLPSFKLRIFVY
jgi:hypothetical protein